VKHRLSTILFLLGAAFVPASGVLAQDAAEAPIDLKNGSADFSEYAGGSPVVELVDDSSKSSFLLPGLKIDLSVGSSVIHDSNTSQTANGESASLLAFSFGGNVKSGDQTGRGGFYGFDYQGQAFFYDESASELGRDPFEHQFGGFVGVNGGLTTIRLDLDYRRNNGNSLQFDQIQRETRRAASDDYTFGLTVKRKVSRVNVEAGVGHTLRDFDAGNGFNDGASTFGDIAGFVTPSFAPKTSVGTGFRFGTDDFDGNPEQDYFTPSFRWRYQLSKKTALHSNLGYEFRSVEGVTGQDSENLVYNGGVDWAATAKTGFNLAYYSRVQPSYVINGEDSEQTGLTLQMTNRLPAHFQLTSRIGYENADYFANQTGGAGTREDNFLRLSLDLSRPLMITEKLLGQWGIFYNYNQNDSNIALSSFDQSVVGIRVGLVY